ncbi:hypothetical protein NPIL_539791 [Nephila pilipes]|uniref:Uncharacterized protein n=1 Tax=Nephila pilipes TaxID=299642 RepID=A0A8X6U8R8_NEPPI|nr:hypothetical protein NPIL_539791 [Nephila pilipes]
MGALMRIQQQSSKIFCFRKRISFTYIFAQSADAEVSRKVISSSVKRKQRFWQRCQRTHAAHPPRSLGYIDEAHFQRQGQCRSTQNRTLTLSHITPTSF